jgi:hypothetical protein
MKYQVTQKAKIQHGRTGDNSNWRDWDIGWQLLGYPHKACRKSIGGGLLKRNWKWLNITGNNYQFMRQWNRERGKCYDDDSSDAGANNALQIKKDHQYHGLFDNLFYTYSSCSSIRIQTIMPISTKYPIRLLVLQACKCWQNWHNLKTGSCQVSGDLNPNTKHIQLPSMR